MVRQNQSLVFALTALTISMALSFGPVQPVLATRQAPELATLCKSIFPECRFRLDGALEHKSDLYLPVMPAVAKKGKIALVESYPAGEKTRPDCLVFDNGVTFIRVVASGKLKTFPALTGLSEKAKKQIMAGKLVDDLIVPEGFYLPTSFKPVVGQTAVALIDGVQEHKGEPTKRHISGKHGGIFLTSRHSGVVSLVDETTLKLISDFPTEGTPAGMAYVDGLIYIADQSKNRVLILDPVAKRFAGQIDLLPKSAPKAVVALPSGKLLYVSESGTADVAIIEVETGKVLLRTKVAPGPARMAITPNGNTIVVLNSITGQATFISTLNQKVLGIVNVGANPTAVVISPDGKTAYISCRGASNQIAVVDIVKRGIIANIKTGNGPTGLALSADGSTLYNAVAKDNLIAVFDTATRSSIKQIKLPLDIDFPGNIALMPGGKKLIVSSATTTAFGVLNVESGEFESQPVIGHSSDEIIWAPID
jgi:DNA-binding beta-propeller fold protein YncE